MNALNLAKEKIRVSFKIVTDPVRRRLRRRYRRYLRRYRQIWLGSSLPAAHPRTQCNKPAPSASGDVWAFAGNHASNLLISG